MIRSLPATQPGTRPALKAAKSRVFLGLRALVAFVLTALQLLSALHFTLVPHTFSAALGGVVHMHGASPAVRTEPRTRTPNVRTETIAPDSLSCAVDLCPYADAPHGSLPGVEATVSGVVVFGTPRLLSEAPARSARTWRVFSNAPKTSPPV